MGTLTYAGKNGERPLFRRCSEFVEKPDADTAKKYVESGEYYWNSGMFMFRARVYLAELKRHAPAMLVGLRGRRRGAPRATSISRACQRRNSAPAPAIPSTTR